MKRLAERFGNAPSTSFSKEALLLRLYMVSPTPPPRASLLLAHSTSPRLEQFPPSPGSIAPFPLPALQFMERETVAIICPQSSVIAHVVSHISNELQVPLLYFASTDPTLSSLQYPFFVKTTQNDLFQMAAIVDIIDYFGYSCHYFRKFSKE